MITYIPHPHNSHHHCLTKEEVEQAVSKSLKKEFERQRTLEAKAWVKRAKKERAKEENKLFWEWIKESKEQDETTQ